MDWQQIERMPGAEVVGRDGPIGHLSALGVRPRKHDEVTHLVVRRGFLFYRDVLVPAEKVRGVEGEAIAVDTDLCEVVQYPTFRRQSKGLLPQLLALTTWPLRQTLQVLVRERLDKLQYQTACRFREAQRTLSSQKLYDRGIKPLTELLDLNTATEEQLVALNGIGPALARRIIERRPFRSIDELAEFPEISEHTFHRLRRILKV